MLTAMARSHRLVRLDELERLPGPGTLLWHPVRATLGLRAFGTNAYTASEAGADVVEAHDELPEADEAAHEELYFVHAGSARFTIDGDAFDAPAGTYVFVPDPASRRHAVALEAGTTVLSFGGPPVFEPSAWEWYCRANSLMDTGELDGVRAILEEGMRLHPDSAGMRRSLARLEAVEGRESAG